MGLLLGSDGKTGKVKFQAMRKNVLNLFHSRVTYWNPPEKNRL